MGAQSYWRWNIREDLLEIGVTFWQRLHEKYPDHFSSAKQAKDFFLNTELDKVKDSIQKKVSRTEDPLFTVTTNHGLTNPRGSFSLKWKGEVFWDSSGSNKPVFVIGEVGGLSADHSLQMPNNPEFYQQLMDNLPDSVFFKDLESRFIAINKACAEKFGLNDPSDAIGKTDFDYFKLSHAQDAFEDEQKIIETEKPVIHKTEKEVYQSEDREPTWTSTSKMPLYNNEGIIIGTFGISTNITKQKKAQKQADRLRSQLMSVFDSDPNMIFVKNWEGEYVLVNKAKAEFHGMEKENILGKTDFDLGVDKNEAEVFLKTDRYVIEEKETVFISEDSAEDPKGNTFWYQTVKVPFKLVDSDQLAALTIVTDITELKKRQLELNESLDIISHQNQRLKNFTHIVSHNLRNHAGSISMILELLDDEESEEEKEVLIDQLKVASDRLNSTIKDLNDMIDQQYKDRKVEREVNIREFLNNTIQILTNEINAENVQFELDVPDNLVFVYNPAYLESILLNFLSNAIKYRHPDRKPVIKVKAYKKDESVHLIVEDNGIGIDLEKHGDKLCGMYETFHDNKDSKGIGLYITKNQVESMGGEIQVESTPGKGTRFHVRLN